MEHWHQHNFFIQVGSQASKYIACSSSGATCMHHEHQLNFLIGRILNINLFSRASWEYLPSIGLWAWVWTMKFVSFSSNNTNNSQHKYLYHNKNNGLHHDFLSQYAVLTLSYLLLTGSIIGIKIHCMLNIRGYMHVPGTSSIFPVTGRISDINLISSAS